MIPSSPLRNSCSFISQSSGLSTTPFALKISSKKRISASGVITAITKATGKRFWKFEVPTRSTANATSNPVGSTENGTLFFEQTITFPVNKRDATTRNIVTELAKNRVIAVTKDKDGSYRMYFKDYGGYLGQSTGQTGAAAGDANGYVLNFEGQEKNDFYVVQADVAAALETAG
jgi:hypothetical protein